MQIIWESIKSDAIMWCMERAKVPGGWLIVIGASDNNGSGAISITFYPDPDHEWDGNSLP